ncbi:FAD binding domain-containing protein [Hypomontagnella monticulosa]|nr:FAD binding domain-containing protein [Hypomontagnella monticulosa]
MVEQVDVLICGGGSAGVCAGVWLARRGVNFRILERRSGPLETGQADGVQCRTVEVFESFGLSEPLLKESYHCLELAFWAPGSAGIKRTYYAADTEPGLSHLPHVLLSQARINGLLTDEIERAAGRSCIEYGCEVLGLEVDSEQAQDPNAYCVTVKALKDGTEREYRAKYVLGSDGAHSVIRKALGFKMLGDTSDAVWGVMDIYPRTNFPDIRKKAVVNSEAGNMIIIPREGDFMVRFYIELKGVVAKDVTLEQLHAQARLILSPYTLDVAETPWWSAYSIGQRLADQFHKDYRVFLSGDACHTHSPKAGQGMNVSLQDGYNIGWKLAAVIQGRALPALLETYVSERQRVAAELIEFDRNWTKLFSTEYRRRNGITPEQFHDQFVLSGRYTAGLAIQYGDSTIVSAETSEVNLATALTVGMRFPSAQVIRFCDARAIQLVRAMPADSRWHIVVFPGDIRDSGALTRLQNVSTGLEKIIDAFTPSDVDRDSIINPILILSSGRAEIEQDQIPDVFRPVVGEWKMQSPLNVYVDEEGYHTPHGHAYEKYGVDPNRGALIIVRPDHYIAKISSFENVDAVAEFFSKFMKGKP